MLKVLDLFSGIGGFAYASERIVGGFKTVGFCEIDPFCQKVLKKNFPNVPIYTDIKELEQNAVRFRGYVDVICGGFPCQPWSNAGKKEGHEDQKGRDLWPEMVSIIKQVLPRFVIGENVRGFVNMPMGLPRSVNDLESIGYRVASFVIPSAYALGLPHRRERCWIIAELLADTDSNGHERGCSQTCNEASTRQDTQSEWRTNTKDVKRQSNDGLDSGEPRVDGDLSGSSDRGTTTSTDTTGVCGLSKDADNDQGTSNQHKYQEDNDRTLVSQGQKGLQLSKHRGLATDQTIAENNTIRSGDDNNSNERMENKESNVAYTNSIRCRGGNCKGCSDCKRQVLSTERKGREMGSEVEGCSQSHRGEETVANTEIKQPNESTNDTRVSKQKQGEFRGSSCRENETVTNTDNERLQGHGEHRQVEREHGQRQSTKKNIPHGKEEDLANSNGIRQQRSWETIEPSNTKKDKIRETSRSDNASKRQRSGRKSFLKMGYLADGISQRLAYDYTIEPKDLPRVVKGEEKRAEKLKSLGNSIVPQCASVFFQAIKDIYEDQKDAL